MQQTKSTDHFFDVTDHQRRTARTRQTENIEVLIAASECQDVCAEWIADRFLTTEQVSL